MSRSSDPAQMQDHPPLRRLVCDLRDEIGAQRFGDCLVLGMPEPSSLSPVVAALHDSGLQHKRFFFVGAMRAQRHALAMVAIKRGELDDTGIRSLRARHKIHRVSVLCVANDAIGELAALVGRLDSLLADHVLLVALAATSRAPATIVESQLQNQTQFSSAVVLGAGSHWLAARLRRNFCI